MLETLGAGAGPDARIFLEISGQFINKLGCPPSQDAGSSPPGLWNIFSRGSQPKPSFATVTGRGDNPNYKSLTVTWTFRPFWAGFPYYSLPKLGWSTGGLVVINCLEISKKNRPAGLVSSKNRGGFPSSFAMDVPKTYQCIIIGHTKLPVHQ